MIEPIRYAVVRALRGMSRSPSIQLITISTIAVCLLIVGGVTLLGENLGRLAASWGKATHVTVYLEDATGVPRAQKLAEALAKLQGVESTKVVEPREAYQRLRRSLADRADLLDGVEETFLPLSIDVTFKPGVIGMLRAHPVLGKLRAAPGVEEVEIHDGWAERLVRLEAVARQGALFIGFLVVGACLFVIGATIRLGVNARKDAIQIEKLVGATDAFVRAPFLLEGALQGFLGTAVALALLYALYQALAPQLASALSSMLAAVPLAFFSPSQLALALLGGAGLGLVASAAAARTSEDA